LTRGREKKGPPTLDLEKREKEEGKKCTLCINMGDGGEKKIGGRHPEFIVGPKPFTFSPTQERRKDAPLLLWERGATLRATLALRDQSTCWIGGGKKEKETY